jgi:hypothetical protein
LLGKLPALEEGAGTMKPKTDFEMMMIHLRTAVSLIPSASSELSLQERRRFIVEKASETCLRAKGRVLVSDIVDLTGLPDYQVIDTLRRSSAFDVFSETTGCKPRLFAKLKEAISD